MKDRFYNPFDGSRRRSAPQPHKLKKYKPAIYFLCESGWDWYQNDKNGKNHYYIKLNEEE